jgi:hypothetical protein
VENNLPVTLQQICRQVGMVVRSETHPIVNQRVRYFFLPVGTVYTVIGFVLAVMVGVNLAYRDYRNATVPGPGHYPADSAQNTPVISYARITLSQEEVPLRVDIYKHMPATSF